MSDLRVSRGERLFKMSVRKFALVSLVTLLLTLTAPSFARRSGHSHAKRTDSAPKTVHVKSYTKKNGEHVHSHNRRLPKSHK